VLTITRALEAVNVTIPKLYWRIAPPTPSRAYFSHIAGVWRMRSNAGNLANQQGSVIHGSKGNVVEIGGAQFGEQQPT